MITILFSMTVKAEREDEWREMLEELYRSTHAEDAGCLAYTYLRRLDRPREYVLFEQWTDEDALSAHLARLARMYGAPPKGGRLPSAVLDLFERTEATRYEPAL